MKKPVLTIRTAVPYALLLLGILFLVSAFGMFRRPGDAGEAALRLEKRIADRIAVLEERSAAAMDSDSGEWIESGSLPEDMVIYRYLDDTLQSWVHQFTVLNDDISERRVVQRLTNPRVSVVSPLSGVGEEWSYMNLGPKWYLVRMQQEGNCKLISGLELVNTLDWQRRGGVSRFMRLPERFSIEPLSTSGGAEVRLGGRPMLKVVDESLDPGATADATLVWLAFAFMVAALIGFLRLKPTLKSFGAALAALVPLVAMMMAWGRSAKGDVEIFSPSLYAQGAVFSSLGAVLLINLAVTIAVICLYMVREDFYRRFRDGFPRAAADAVLVLLALGIMAYGHATLVGIIRNSNISLELYKFSDLSVYTLLVYLSFISMLLCLPLLGQMLWRRDRIGNAGCILFSIAIAAYLTSVSGVLGFRKEQDKLEVWANRLAIERDMSLEILLRRVESQIAEDAVIPALIQLRSPDQSIRNRILETYLPRLPQIYGVTVYTFRDADASRESVARLNARMLDAESVAEGSRFFHTPFAGSVRYTGVFLYYNPEVGLTRMLLCIDPLSTESVKGYYSLLQSSLPGKVFIPETYSYARYKGDDLQLFRGDYAYSTKMDRALGSRVYGKGDRHIKMDGYSHFVTVVTDDEAVIISRPVLAFSDYLVAFLFLALMAYVVLSLPRIGPRRTEFFEKRYYRRRITTVLMFFLIMTLFVMAGVSMAFVYRRNNANLHTIMSSQVSALQSLVEYRVRSFSSLEEIGRSELLTILQRTSANTKQDLTVYSPDGKVFLSTTPGLFERMLLGSRINEEACHWIIDKDKRYFIHKETIGARRYYSMYAPLKGKDGAMLGILCSPYADRNYDFEMDAAMHAMTILVVFFILLIVARLTSGAVVGRMFRPLLEMGRKMASANLDSLEYIEYDRDDEISTLVSSYNRMVADLTESTRKLAQAERDKAWSEMARQVAHEIKNPLTPMKLQIQRLVRLKQKGDPQWQERFEEVSRTLLDHIDILTETANEFSTFAKLYTEEPSRIDLDKVLQEEISMYDNKGPVEFVYYGLEGATVSGPKPQLTRVFVNLLNNAVQAVGEGGGRVAVSLRNSVQDGFYDIVFEDDGPGVSEENVGKLFTPNFTTKSAGSGLGLAISRSILERCSATIRYSRSFTLGGACFTITYPK